MQTFVSHIERLPPAEAAAVTRAIRELVLRQIDAAGPLGWLPLSVNLECTRAVADTLGRERTHLFFRSLLAGTLETPLLRGLVVGVLRVAVKDPALYIPWVSRGFEIMFRDVGKLNVEERRPKALFTELSGLPAECVEERFWLESVASACCALSDLVGLQGIVTLDAVDAEARRAVFRWMLL
jgi:hypothetical protein